MIGNRMLHLKGCEEVDALLGEGPAEAVVDEAAHIKNLEEVWERALQPALADKLGACGFTSSVKGRNYFWRLWKKGQPGREKEPDWVSWKIKTADVGTVPAWELDRARREMSSDYYRQEFEAEFLDYVGVAVSEFINRDWPEGNILPRALWQGIKDNFSPYGIIDWAPSTSGSTCREVFMVDGAGRTVFIHELIQPGGTPSRAAGAFKKQDTDLKVATPFSLIGRDAYGKESNQVSPADALQAHGIRLMPCSPHLDQAVAGLNDMCVQPPSDAGSGAMPYPLFMVLAGECPRLVEQLSTIQYDDLDRHLQGKRDAFDCARMAVMAKLRGRARTPANPRPLWWQRGYDAGGSGLVNPVSGRPM
jgi:hypothetical protein